MFNLKTLLVRALLALSLAIGAAPAALAGPTYQVAIDSSALPQARFLDLQFLSNGGAGPALAYVSKLSGDFGAVVLDNASGDPAAGFTIDNSAGFNAVLLELLTGGTIRFDVQFSGPDSGDGVTFSAALLDEMFNYLGADVPLVTISLVPGESDALSFEPGLAAVNVVPEPSDWLLLATGLLLIGAIRRSGARR